MKKLDEETKLRMILLTFHEELDEKLLFVVCFAQADSCNSMFREAFGEREPDPGWVKVLARWETIK